MWREEGDNGRLGRLMAIVSQDLGPRLAAGNEGDKQTMGELHQVLEVLDMWLHQTIGQMLIDCLNAGQHGETHGGGVDKATGIVDQVVTGGGRRQYDCCWGYRLRVVASSASKGW